MQPCLSGRLYSGESEGRSMKKKHWYDYLWIWSILYFFLGFFNILFAWLGMIDFLVPVLIAVIGGNKWFCNNLCAVASFLLKSAENGSAHAIKKRRNGWRRRAFVMGFSYFFW